MVDAQERVPDARAGDDRLVRRRARVRRWQRPVSDRQPVVGRAHPAVLVVALVDLLPAIVRLWVRKPLGVLAPTEERVRLVRGHRYSSSSMVLRTIPSSMRRAASIRSL